MASGLSCLLPLRDGLKAPSPRGAPRRADRAAVAMPFSPISQPPPFPSAASALRRR